MPRFGPRLALALLLAATAAGLGARCVRLEFPGYAVIRLSVGTDLEDRLRAALRTAKPGTVIELPAGRYELLDEVTITTSHIVLRGQGMHETILGFEHQRSGAEGILGTADQVVFQDLAVENARGDGIRVEGANGVTFDRVRVEWTGGPKTTNGAYGVYPVGCRNVLIQHSVVKGASDAGIYVGQSRNIVVRQNDVQWNVAGIEIENSQDADVYLNVTTNNTGGILVFDLPGLSLKGMRTRVFSNLIFHNNTQNFAPVGNIVASVPTGTGVLVMANRDVEVFDNFIDDHLSVSAAVVSHEVLNLPVRTARDYKGYDPYPERIRFHGNRMTRSGAQPSGDLGLFSYILFKDNGGMPSVIYDGILENDVERNTTLPEAQKLPLLTEKTDPATGRLWADRRLCFRNNGDATIGDFNELRPPVSRDASHFDCSYPPLPAVMLEAPTEPPVIEDEYSPEEVAALCATPGSGVNWAATVVSCPRLSDYRLFAGNDPLGTPNDGGIPYDLTTPLFSDYSTKFRVVFVPPGSQASYDPEKVLDFPVGTILAKTFTFRNDLANPALGERLVETRLLVRRPTGWAGLPYVWAEDRSEAFFTPLGAAQEVTFRHTDGEVRTIDYRVPNVTQCTQCHGISTDATQGDVPIGPKVRLLNKSYAYAGGIENQLSHWKRLGKLAATDEEIASAPRLPAWDDPLDGTQGERARAYLESNCAHCHNPQGRARFSALFLEASRPMGLATGVCKTPISAGTGSGQLTFDLVPGNPDESIIPFRMDSVEPAVRMPELSKATVHDEGVALVREWIASLPDQDCIHNGN